MLYIRRVEEIQYSKALIAALVAALLTALIAIWLWFFQYRGDNIIFVLALEYQQGFFSQSVVSVSPMSIGVFCTIMSLAIGLAYSILHYRRMIAQRADISEVEIVAFSKRDFRNSLAWLVMSVVLCLLLALGTELIFQLMALISRDTRLVPPLVAVIISTGYIGIIAFFLSRWMLGLLTIDILATGVFVLLVGIVMAILLTTYSDWYENPFSVLGELLRDESGTVINSSSARIFSSTFIVVSFLLLAYFLEMHKFFMIMVDYKQLARIFALIVLGLGLIGAVGLLLVGLVPDGMFHNLGAQGAGLGFVGMMLFIPWFVPTSKGRDYRFVAFSIGLALILIGLYIFHLSDKERFPLIGMELAGISFTVIFLYTFTIHSLAYMESLDLPDVSREAQALRGNQ